MMKKSKRSREKNDPTWAPYIVNIRKWNKIENYDPIWPPYIANIRKRNKIENLE